MKGIQLILASASPRRGELLKQIGISYLSQPVNIDETPLAGETARQYVLRMAAEKAAAGSKRDDDLPVLACDTAVILNDRILGKPKDQQDALAMLAALSGNTHQVYSAVSLLEKQHRQSLSITEVLFRELKESEIAAYWQTGEPVDKAGGYAIQGMGAQFVKQIKGSYSGVVGLPLYETTVLLTQAGIQTILQH